MPDCLPSKVVDIVPFSPPHLTPTFVLRIRDFYIETFHDKFFEDPPAWFRAYNLMEVVYHTPLSVWAIRGLLRGESGNISNWICLLLIFFFWIKMTPSSLYISSSSLSRPSSLLSPASLTCGAGVIGPMRRRLILAGCIFRILRLVSSSSSSYLFFFPFFYLLVTWLVVSYCLLFSSPLSSFSATGALLGVDMFLRLRKQLLLKKSKAEWIRRP